MSKRIREMKTEGEPAVAKPKSVCLFAKNLMRETAARQKPKPSDVFPSVERRQTVSKELRETAASN